ncbi:hypothetical protein [Anabaena azotica]|uniref:Uncharacterized protein n=1 Tax=Anabaena azotica FACHB-119 TaxID=947527 RepID=A0ABR8DDE5_9NOST|nr:hypothetical protein [Anabaena azotica]MBD2505094.1 hypothetical protein [Anabaena azotica FACHB-119]
MGYLTVKGQTISGNVFKVIDGVLFADDISTGIEVLNTDGIEVVDAKLISNTGNATASGNASIKQIGVIKTDKIDF